MKRNSGQIVVFVLLIMLLGLTVGLSITSRTLSDLKQSNITDQSARAFSAAEAGIEQALRQDLSGLVGSNNQITIGSQNLGNYTVSQNTTSSYTPDSPIAANDVISINLDSNPAGSGWNTAGQLLINWSKSTEVYGSDCAAEPPNYAALELSFYTRDGSTYGVTRMAFNPSCGSSLSTTNYFSSSNTGDTIGPTTYISKVTVTPPTYTRLLRIKPIYQNASLAIQPTNGAQLPAQAYTVTATGVVGDTQRLVQVTRTIGSLPSIFDYVLFSGSSIQ
jgi:hypothetical protein